MSDISTVGSRYNGADLEYFDKASGTTLLAFRSATSALNPLGVAAVDLSVAPGVIGGSQFIKVTLTAAQIKALSGTPISILPAPGAGLATIITNAMFYLKFGTTAFAAGSVLELVQNAIQVASTSAALVNGGASALIQAAIPGLGTTQSNGAANAATTVTVVGANFTTGDSTIDVLVWYKTIQV